MRGRRARLAWAAALWWGCEGFDKGLDSGSDGGGAEDPPLLGFIGSPCADDGDCAYPGGLCVGEAPGGVCTAACDQLCPDQAGFPVTFCVDAAALPADPRLTEGACVSRCDLGAYPREGCRADYGCAQEPRYAEPETVRYACLPDRPSALSDCHRALAAAGAPFEPTVVPPEVAAGSDGAVCSVQDAVLLRGPIKGVALLGASGSEPLGMITACEAALSVVDTIDSARDADPGVTGMRHFGAYNCRVIAGTRTLSRHGYGDAVDIAGWVFSDGRDISYLDDWAHNEPRPADPAARFLRDQATAWHQEALWNILLTPDYNAAHDNHVHADLTPGAYSIGRAALGPIGD